MPQLKYINHGMCSRVGDTVYVNKKLINHPTLYHKLLEHENKHSCGLNFKDMLIDIDNLEIATVRSHYYRFMLKNPSSWTVFLPFWIINGEVVWDFNMIVLWAFLFTIIIFIIALI